MRHSHRTATPQRNESLLGYLRRQGRHNSHLHTSAFLTELGVKYGHRLVEDIAEVEQKLGLPSGTLEAIQPSSPPKKASLDWKFERHHSDPVCPQCLAEGKPYQASWRHALVCACPEHRTRLQDSCLVCHEQLRPNFGGFATCGCGFDLSKLPEKSAEAHEIVVAALISGGSSAEPLAFYPGALNFEPQPDAGKFVEFLAVSKRETSLGKAGKGRTPKNVEETVSFLEPLRDVLGSWPSGFRSLVRSRLRDGEAAGNSAPAQLGKWYQRLKKFKGPAYEPFLYEVGQVVAEEFSGTYVGSIPMEKVRNWVPAQVAARGLGIRADRLVEAVRARQIEGKVTNSGFGHNHTVVPMETVELIKQARERFSSASVIKQAHGLTRAQFELLREAGIFLEVSMPERPSLVDGGFDAIQVNAQVEEVRNGASSRVGETLKFSELNLRRTTDRRSLINLFRAIFECKVRAVAAPEHAPLGEFLFLRCDVEQLLRDGRSSLDWTANDVAKITGWKAQSIVHWCKLGLLEARTVPHGKASYG